MESNENKHEQHGEQAAAKSASQSGAKLATHSITEEERQQVRSRTNARIAHWCSFAVLVIILIDFAAYVIGQADQFFTTAGIMIAIALLAIALLHNPIDSSSKK